MSKVVAVVAVLALVSGCSVALQKKPSSGKVATSECSATSAYWIADTVGAVAGAGTALAGFAFGGDSEHTDRNYTIGGVAALASIVYLASAHNGYKWAHQCSANQESAPVAQR
jgi:uncharacterized membrane protein YebE (DUF533 family)